MQVQVRWYEKLHSWEKALNLYKHRLDNNHSDLDSKLGYMRCLEALGEWNELGSYAKEQWGNLGEGKCRAGRLAAVAAWGLQDFDQMREYVACIPEETQDSSFYRAVLAIRDSEFEIAQSLIDETRDLLDTELTAMAGESYERELY